MGEGLAADLAAFVGTEILQENRAVGLDEPLFSGGLVNSFGLLRILTHVADSHGVSIEGYEVADANIDTIRALAGLVASRRSPS